jgi:enolase
MREARFRVAAISAVEILDSRGEPTVRVHVLLADGAAGRADVPSGASTGRYEAAELRDHDPTRYFGLGVQMAVSSVTEIEHLLCGRWWSGLDSADAAMCALDGTENKSRLGANALTGVSLALARALARSRGQELYEWVNTPGTQPRIPIPHFNLINGGAHARNGQAFQEFMIAPLGAPSVREGVRAAAEIYGALRSRLRRAGHSTALGDEGGFAPEIEAPEEVLALLTGAIADANYTLGRDGVALALDAAASQFRGPDGRYTVDRDSLTTDQLIDRYAAMVERFGIWSIEDGLAEDDTAGWVDLTSKLGDRVQLVGDDIFVTNSGRIAEGVQRGIGNAVLIKPNQIGTLSETLHTISLCRSVGYAQMVSHRSGETVDTFVADLAVGSGCGQLKAGAPARGERVEKYNRLMDIEQREPKVPFGLAPPAER